MRHLIPMFYGWALISSAGFAKSTEVGFGPVPTWAPATELMAVPENPSGLIFVRRQSVVIHLDDRGQAQYTSYRIKLLHPNALQLGNIALTWNPAAGDAAVHFINVYRDGQSIDILKSTKFEILRREGQLEAAILDGNLTAVLRVPDLRVGDELEVGTTIRYKDPTLGPVDSGLLLLGAEPSPGRFLLGINWADGQNPEIKMSPDMSAVAVRSQRAIEFRFDNPAVLNPAKDAPPRFQWQRIVEFSDFTSWAAISQRFAPLYAKAATLTSGSPLKEEARRIAATHADKLSQASAALKLVQQNVRYIYVGLDGGNLTPASADETWQRRYGDCKGKTALLLALLAELGISAEAVLANNAGNDDGLDERLPSPRIFDHVLVRAQIGGTTYYLDGTLPPVVLPGVTPILPYRWVLPLSDQGASLAPIKWQPSKTPEEITLYDIDARAGFDVPAKITSTTIYRAIKGIQQQMQLSALTPQQLLSSFQQNAVGGTWQTIDDVQWRYDEKIAASVLRISGTGKVDWDDDGDGARSTYLPGGGFYPPERRVRAEGPGRDLPYENKLDAACYVTTVRLPASTKPNQWSFNSSFATRIFGKTYYRAFDLRDGALRMVRGSRVDVREISAAAAKADNEKIGTFDNSMAWAYFKPGGYPPPTVATRVPTTTEIDWTADNVPCLPAAR